VHRAPLELGQIRGDGVWHVRVAQLRAERASAAQAINLADAGTAPLLEHEAPDCDRITGHLLHRTKKESQHAIEESPYSLMEAC
jgi:hypothetical protein